jgi:hypothetical protein
MTTDKKIYLYSAIAIASGLGIYFYNQKKKNKLDATGEGTAPEEETTNENNGNTSHDVTTPTGDTISQNQVAIPTDLAQLLTKSSAQLTKDLKGKPVYAKLDNVKIRTQNFVNNGVINNLDGNLTKAGIWIGNIDKVEDDKGAMTNPSGKVYKWFYVLFSQIAIDDLNKSIGWYLPSKKAGFKGWVREDAIKLSK